MHLLGDVRCRVVDDHMAGLGGRCHSPVGVIGQGGGEPTERVGGHREVDEPGPGDLDVRADVVGIEPVDDLGRQLSRVASGTLRQGHHGVRLEVAERLVLAPADQRIGVGVLVTEHLDDRRHGAGREHVRRRLHRSIVVVRCHQRQSRANPPFWRTAVTTRFRRWRCRSRLRRHRADGYDHRRRRRSQEGGSVRKQLSESCRLPGGCTSQGPVSSSANASRIWSPL